MEKQHYFFRLIPPRPTFPADITANEAALMERHGVYWAKHFAAGRILAYGPVFVPGAAFGLGILEVEDEAEARRFGENDPSVLEGLNRYEIHPMRVVAARAKG
ncbi:MAG TPA: YciI family protein [Terracidiphilus sp.]|nr:YciI family protein [Terracidiphilus sp.]